MRRTFAVMAGSALALGATAAGAQQKIPVVELSSVAAKSSETLGSILNVRQLPSGNLLVNDATRRRVMMFDSTLSHPSVVIDSTSGANGYGPRGSPLISYLGDSTLFVDGASQSLVVIDPKGKISRVMSAPKPGDLRFLASGQGYIDNLGRLLYRGPQVVSQVLNRDVAPAPGTMPALPPPPDSVAVVRADFDTRSVDTIGRVKIQNGTKMDMTPGANGAMKMKMTINPLSTVDDWAVLSDGSIAFIRGHDYHVDWIDPNGAARSTAKLPFDWKRLTDEDKQKLIDSARDAQAQAAAKSAAAGADAKKAGAEMELGAVKAAMAGMGGGGGGEVRVMVQGGGGGMGGAGGPPMTGMMSGGPGGPMTMIAPEVEFVPIKEIADYYPAIRPNAARPDMDGNLWILPTTSAQSTNGELVYDVVNRRGELFQRVRIPSGRSVVGFGKGGIVYLASGDRTNGFFVERARLIGGVKVTPSE